MLQYEISFEQPAFLLLLLLAPLFWVVALRSRASLGRLRWTLAVALRMLIFALLVLAIAGFQWVRRTDDVTVLYLVDRSLSIPRASLDRAVEFVNASIAQHRREDRGDRAGVISFGKQAAVEVPPLAEPFHLTSRFETELVLEETDLAAALRLARSVMAHPSARRVVILSDGNVTQGNVQGIAAELVRDGIGVDVVAIPGELRAEVAVEKLVVPTEVRKGAPFEIRVALSRQTPPTSAAATPTRGSLSIYRHDQDERLMIASQSLTLDSETHYLTLRDQLETPGFYSYEAEFTPEDPAADGFVQNNTARGFAQIRGAGRVLLIEDHFNPGSFDELVQLLQREKIEVTVQRTDQLFTSLADLQAYDLVILADVPRGNGEQDNSLQYFTDQQIEMLVQNTRQMGCGLMMLGGPNSFGVGGWSDTKLEEAMPVDFQIKNLKVQAVGALALVIDSSGSMSGEKIQLSKAAAVAAAKSLRPQDSIGVFSFDTEVHQIVPMQEVSDRGHIIPMISRLAADGGTNMQPAMQLGFRALANSNAATKHMIILSDGHTQPGNFNELATQMRQQGMTVTCVAIGDEADTGLLNQIAAVGGGKFYQVNSPRAIPQIFMREARRVARPLIYENQSGIPLELAADHEVLRGIEPPFPPVTGYVMTTVKPTALVQTPLLASLPSGQANSILASWQFGLGRSVALTTDVGQRWASRWKEWPERDKLLVQLVRWTMRPTNETDHIAVDAHLEGDRIRIVMNALDLEDRFINFLSPQVAVVGPGMQASSATLQQSAPGRYVGEVEASDKGTYFLSISPGAGSETIRLGIDVNRSAEFRPRPDNLQLLGELAAQTPAEGKAGDMLVMESESQWESAAGALDTFRSNLRFGIDTRPAWYILVVIGCVAFFTDVLNRRLHWNPTHAFRRAASSEAQPTAEVLTLERLQRLRQTKSAAREAVRDPWEETSAPPAAPLPKKSLAPVAAGPEQAESYTERLLRAKREAKRSQQSHEN
ncbi:VWA domain-containing protein [Candidatus Laterigemmans baculatus]|uniref:VWA domain-containing protein n=1 Tax=Candidatus Laterigemmans baculatus TaxID=2770505 RepID=UPI0013DBA995|nr:VWA domain-containing protein [Candidatus Laterigemmans baculatus]